MKLSKYKAVKTKVNEITFDSKKEANHYKKLLLLMAAGKISNLEMQVAYKWIEKHSHDSNTIEFKRKYIADFVYWDVCNQEYKIVDVKGYKTAEYKKKKKIVEEIFKIKITEI